MLPPRWWEDEKGVLLAADRHTDDGEYNIPHLASQP